MRVADDNGLDLIKDIEARRNGTLGWRTFSTWYADSLGKVRERGVFLYLIGNEFWFEDFETTPQIFGIELKARKNAEPYKKFEDHFSAEQIEKIFLVKKNAAKRYSLGYSQKLPKAGLFEKLFSSVVTAVVFKEGTVRFFEIFGKEFENQIKEMKKEG